MHDCRTLLAAAAIVSAFTAAAPAQHVPETAPRPGEQRLNRFQYIASHNSFQRRRPNGTFMPLHEQLDFWGHRHLEIDVWWTGNSWEVAHNCCDQTGKGSLQSYMQDLASAHALQSTFIIVNFDVKDSGACSECYESLPLFWEGDLQNRILNHIDQNTVYTPDEFNSVDSRKWPSVQELIRRGRHIAFTMKTDDDFFFGHMGSPNDPGDVVYRTGDHNTSFSLGDRYFSVRWATGSLCAFENGTQWATAVQNGITFNSTYCLDDLDRLLFPYLHPPDPLYVWDQEYGPQIGTWWRPYAHGEGLFVAIFHRIWMHQMLKGPSNISVVINGGVYDIDPLNEYPEPLHITSTMTLKAYDTPVIITK